MVTEAWRDSKDSTKQKEYWKAVKTWNFDMNTGETLELYSLTKAQAIKRAKAHETWLHSRGFKKDKVLLGTIRERKY